MLITLDGSIIEQSYTLGFRVTNEGKYEVITGLRMTSTLGVSMLEVRCDSLLIVSQVNGEYTAKDDQMDAYLKVITSWKAKLSCCDFKQVLRSENNHADSLATLASTIDFQFRRDISVEHISKPSIHKPGEEVFRLDCFPGWRDPIISYLKNGTFPDYKVEAQKLQHIATRYTLIGELLYKKSYSRLHYDPYLRCLELEEAKDEMREIHNDDCGNHAGKRSLAHKAINQGYYWLKLFENVEEYVKWCPQCQRFALTSNRPSTDLHTLRSPLPFMQ